MSSVYSNQNLEGRSFTKQNLSKTDFSDSNIKSTDFSNSDLSYSNFSNVQAGLKKSNAIFIFIIALILSLISGFIAMLAGSTVQIMVHSQDPNVHYIGIVGIALFIIFIIWSLTMGVTHAYKWFVASVIVVAGIVGIIAIMTGIGTGMGALYLIIAMILISIMFYVGTIARASAGTLSSNILFIVVALSGGMFGTRIGGGIGTVIMAITCAHISKQALKGNPKFAPLKKVALIITTKFGTSFKNANLSYANFSNSVLKNVNLKNAVTTGAKWDNVKKINCLE